MADALDEYLPPIAYAALLLAQWVAFVNQPLAVVSGIAISAGLIIGTVGLVRHFKIWK
jgi:hypothetical protein